MDVEEGKCSSSSSFSLIYGDDDPRSDPQWFEHFHILEAIGVGWKGVTVYKARRSIHTFPDQIRALIYVKKANDEDEDEDEENNNNNIVPLLNKASHNDIVSTECSSILECQKFVDLRGSYHCINFPYMEQGSLLSLMAHRFPRGLPDRLVLLFAYCILVGILSVHECFTSAHGQVSAAHVFVREHKTWGWARRGCIKLAYGATVHHLLADRDRDSGSPYLPATSVCEWAAAPVYSSYIDEHVMKANDIWSFGITLLEMVYGGLRVKTRDDLDLLINKIRKKKKLPNNHNDNVKGEGGCCCCCCLRRHPRLSKRVFSRRFVRMVVRCLDLDPAKRPTARDLHQNKIFSKIIMY